MLRVVQAGRRPRLVLEALETPRVHRRGERQHLQRHPAAQRHLLRLVDDAHAAAADSRMMRKSPSGAPESSPVAGVPAHRGRSTVGGGG